jgi:glycosyltransferase involved in cell wall biosynthesis
MKILMLNYEYPPLGGGAGICTKYESEGLAKLGHKVTVITTWFKGEKEVEENNNLKIIRLKSKRKVEHKSGIFEKLDWAKKSKEFLKEYCKNNKFDVCITNFTIPGGIVGKYLKKKFKIPFIIISHGHDVPWFFPKEMFKYHILTFPWIKNICNSCDRLVLLTSQMKENGDKFMGKQKYKNVIIPNGCESNKFKPNYNKKSKKFKIIFVGRFTIQKDPMTFLKGIKVFSEKNTDFLVNILGDGPLRNEMETFVKKNNLSDKINFLGWVSKEKMLEEYQSANIQVMSSLAEAMSIAALESLCCGQYLLSTPVSGNTDIINKGENGDFFEFGDFNSMAKKLEKYYNNQFKKKKIISLKFVETFRKKYAWANIAKQYDVLVRDIK